MPVVQIVVGVHLAPANQVALRVLLFFRFNQSHPFRGHSGFLVQKLAHEIRAQHPWAEHAQLVSPELDISDLQTMKRGDSRP